MRAARVFAVILGLCSLLAACTRASPPVGTISGHLLMVGGPVGARFPVEGVITVVGTDLTAKVGSDGSFSLRVPPGRYVVSGRSPRFNGGQGRCFAAEHAIVTDGGDTSVDVLCQMR